MYQSIDTNNKTYLMKLTIFLSIKIENLNNFILIKALFYKKKI